MKTKLVSLLVGLVLAVTIAIPITTFTGCAIFGGVAEGSRAEVVRAEQFAKISFALADSFMEYEMQYRATVGDGVKELAKKLEKDFQPAYASFRAATKAYKAFPSGDNLSALQRTQIVLQLIYDQLKLFSPTSVEKEAEIKSRTLKLN